MEGFIISLNSGVYEVYTNEKVYKCKARGKFRNEGIKPVVGDNVFIQVISDTEGYIEEVFPRRNQLIRPPVSNVDQAIIIISIAEPDLSPSLLNRFLTLVEDANIEPVICLSKLDKTKNKDELEKVIYYYSSLGYKVIEYSAKTGEGVERIKEVMKNKKSVLTGQSGVGKSTLLNTLFPELNLEVGEYSKALGRGRHTTREVSFIRAYDGWIADTPGFSSTKLEMDAIRLAAIYPGYNEYFDGCKFRGCLHINEVGCKIKELVEEGTLSLRGYEDYLAFQRELVEGKVEYDKKNGSGAKKAYREKKGKK